MKNMFLTLALAILVSCAKKTKEHEMARALSKELSATELGALSSTFKEAEIRRKESDTRIRGGAIYE